MKRHTSDLTKKIAEQSLSEHQQAPFLQSNGQASETAVELSDECLAMIFGGTSSRVTQSPCLMQQQIGVGANVPIIGGILSNLDATGNDLICTL